MGKPEKAFGRPCFSHSSARRGARVAPHGAVASEKVSKGYTLFSASDFKLDIAGQNRCFSNNCRRGSFLVLILKGSVTANMLLGGVPMLPSYLIAPQRQKAHAPYYLTSTSSIPLIFENFLRVFIWWPVPSAR